MTISERFTSLKEVLSRGLYEKDTEIALSLLAAIAGESVLLLGPPGVAKSMIARRIKCAFSNATAFEYLMSRFSTPDDIFGPVSISKLKESDSYERVTAGFLPEADIVFLDEIWKAGPAILNTLLTIVNEKTFRNGNSVSSVPMKLLIGASNELPAEGEGLEALWDRFLVRMECGCVANEQNFYRILTEDNDESADEPEVDDSLRISPEEYAQWQKDLRTIAIDNQVLECITYIRQRLPKLKIVDEADDNAARMHNVYVSDRRWKHIMRLLRTSAFVHGRKSVTLADIPILLYCLWNEPDEIDALVPIIVSAILYPLKKEIDKLSDAVGVELKNMRVRQALKQAEEQGDFRDQNKEIFNNFYYRIDNYGTGNTYIFLVDYRHLPFFSHINAPADAIIYPDPQNPKRNIIRSMGDALGLNINGVGAMRVKLYRGENDIYMNGVKYPIHTLPRGQRQVLPAVNTKLSVDVDYDSVVEDLSAQLRGTVNSIISNTDFCSSEFSKQINEQMQVLNRTIALTRMNLQKLDT